MILFGANLPQTLVSLPWELLGVPPAGNTWKTLQSTQTHIDTFTKLKSIFKFQLKALGLTARKCQRWIFGSSIWRRNFQKNAHPCIHDPWSLR